MGQSAKLHKRVKKTASSTSQAAKAKPSALAPPTPASASASALSQHTSTPTATRSKPQSAATAKRRTGLKQKAALAAGGAVTRKNRGGEGGSGLGRGHVLGGADYVSLMMGGRRKAREEAERLPRS